MVFTLPNGKPIDTDMVKLAMEDSDICTSYYLNIQTGEVERFSKFEEPSDEREKLLEEITSSDNYIPIERISSHEAYQWMEDFVAQIVAPKNAQIAENYLLH